LLLVEAAEEPNEHEGVDWLFENTERSIDDLGAINYLLDLAHKILQSQFMQSIDQARENFLDCLELDRVCWVFGVLL